MLMSYSFMKEIDLRTWELFKDSTTETDCALEIVNSVLCGRLNLDRLEYKAEDSDISEVFNLEAYNRAVIRNRKMFGFMKSVRKLHITDESGELNGVSEAVVSIYAEQPDPYAEVELQFAVEALCSLYREILIKYRVDFWICIRQSLKGINSAIKLLRGIVEDMPEFGELLWSVLGSGEEAKVLFPQIA